jgi:NADPH:quinone reductase-like Zn-dependent oxidoreductase
VTSSSQEKIQKAIELGAAGGVSYKEEGWDKKLLGMLPSGKKNFDAIIDGAGGDAIEKAARLLKVSDRSCKNNTWEPPYSSIPGTDKHE